MRHQISFKQYNPDKPAKYGLLFKSLNDCRFSYTYKSTVYAGMPSEEPTDYFIKGTENYIKALYLQTNEDVSLQGRNISMDNLYSSISTANWLLSNDSTMIGTIRHNRLGIPPEIKSIDGRELLSTHTFWERTKGDLSITSYVVKTSTGKKNVLLLSSCRPLMGTTKDDNKKKPAILKLYDFTKGGTDNVDQRIGGYSCKPKSSRWTIVAFSFILDTARVNTQTVHAIQNDIPVKSVNSFDFGWKLAESLVLPQIQRRSRVGLTKPILLKMDIMAPPRPAAAERAPEVNRRKRCSQCLSNILGPDQKKKKDKL